MLLTFVGAIYRLAETQAIYGSIYMPIQKYFRLRCYISRQTQLCKSFIQCYYMFRLFTSATSK